MTALRVAKQQLEPFYTPKTLAERLTISERTVRQLLADGTIPSYRVAGLRRIDPRDVDAYLASNRTGRAPLANIKCPHCLAYVEPSHSKEVRDA